MAVSHKNPEPGDSVVELYSRILGGKYVLGRDILSLPGTVAADIGDTKTATTFLATLFDGLVDLGAGVLPATLGVTVNGYFALLAGAISGGRMLTTELSATAIKAAVESLATAVSGGRVLTTDTSTAGIKTSVDALAAIISGGRLLTTEGSAAAIKVAVEALAAIISGGKLLTTETSAAGIKTAVDALAAIISGGRLLTSETNSASIKTAVEAVSAIISASKLAVADATAASKLDTLHTDLGTLHTDLATTLAGYTDGLETKLDTVATNQGVPSGGPKLNQNSDIDTGADRTFSSQALTRGMVIKNISASGQLLYISHAATPTSTNSFVLAPGEFSPFLECTNANVPLMRPSADNAAACYAGV